MSNIIQYNGKRTSLSMKTFTCYTKRAVITVLLITALLKIIYFFNIAATPVKSDPVLGMITNREFLLIASFFEIFISFLLLKENNDKYNGIIILYFCVFASIYQTGLYLNGNVACPCLGVATDWLGSGLTPIVSRMLLLLLWSVGLILCFRKQIRSLNVTNTSLSRTVQLISAFGLFALSNNCFADLSTIHIEGEYRFSTISTKGHLTNKQEPIQAMFDKDSLLVTSSSSSPGPKMEGGPCYNRVYITKDIMATAIECPGLETTSVSLAGSEAAFEMGTCQDIYSSTLFLMIRCCQFFPSTNGPNTRRLSETWTMRGAPLALVTESQYEYSYINSNLVLKCDIYISPALKSNWMASPYLPAGFDLIKSKRREEIFLSQYKPGFLCQRMQFTSFTNIGGYIFPTMYTSEVYDPKRTNIINSSTNNTASFRYGNDQCQIISIKSLANQKVSLLPLTNKNVSVSEERLTNKKLRIGGVLYLTNNIQSYDIDEQAKNIFKTTEITYQEKIDRAVRQKYLINIMILLIMAGPLLYALINKYRMSVVNANNTK